MSQKTKKTTPGRAERSQQPVAPVSGRLLAGVVLLSMVGLLLAAMIPSDVAAIAGCIAVLLAGGMFLDKKGRERAVQSPHPLYEPGRLPQSSPKLKVLAMVMTLVFLVLILGVTAGPDRAPSPFPFFLAAGWIYLLLPQLLARRALRIFESAEKKLGEPAKETPGDLKDFKDFKE